MTTVLVTITVVPPTRIDSVLRVLQRRESVRVRAVRSTPFVEQLE